MTKRAFRSIGLGLGWGLSLGLALLGAALPARADDHGPRVPMPAKYLQECASCHAAYPPGLLPAPSWLSRWWPASLRPPQPSACPGTSTWSMARL